MTVRNKISLLLLLASCAGMAEEKASPLKESEVKAVFQAMDAALQKKDVATALSHLAETAQIHLAINSAQGPQIIPMGRKEYGDVLSTTLSDAVSYKLERKAPVVTPLKDGKTLYTDLVTETIQTKGKKTRNLNEERALLERIDGKAVITQMETSVLMSD